MNTARRTSVWRALPILMLAAIAAAGCDIVTADLKAKETAEWRKTYELQPGGRVEITNVNGLIEVSPSSGNTVEVVALKSARGGTADQAKQVLNGIEIREEASPDRVRIETKLPSSGGGWFHRGSPDVRYTVRVPASAEVHFTTQNGGIEANGLKGPSTLTTTNGGIRARDIAGGIVASTTNGGVDVDVAQIGERGVKLECTNGGIRLRLPSDAKASISASVTNGGIDADGLTLDASESSRRRLEGKLNGGGPRVQLEGTNGGIRISAR